MKEVLAKLADYERLIGAVTIILGGISCAVVSTRWYTASKRIRWLHVSALIALFALYVAGILYVWDFQVDDKYISLRFAKNLAEGHGLVFNPGGPRIEGYTNFLLVLLEAAFFEMGSVDAWPTFFLLPLAGLLLIGLVYWYTWSINSVEFEPVVALGVAAGCTLLIATSSPVIIWAVSGMETILFSLLLTAAVISYLMFLRDMHVRWPGLLVDPLFLLATLCRPEGILFWGVSWLHRGAMWIFGRRRLPVYLLVGFVASALAASGYLFWKVTYFGSVFPTSFLVKVHGISVDRLLGGVVRLIGFAAVNANYGVLSVILAGSVLVYRYRQSPEYITRGLVFALASMIVYAVYLISLGFRVSMDGTFRLYVPLIPLISVSLAEIGASLAPLINRHRHQFLTACLVGCLFLISERTLDLYQAWNIDLNWGLFPMRISGHQLATGIRTGHIALGRWLKDIAAPDAKIVLFDAGAIPYFSGLYTIDTWSLTDPVLVSLRHKFLTEGDSGRKKAILEKMRDYVLEKDPDYIVQDNLGILSDPTVRERYENMGVSFRCIEGYVCGPDHVCNYVLEPWGKRVDIPH